MMFFLAIFPSGRLFLSLICKHIYSVICFLWLQVICHEYTLLVLGVLFSLSPVFRSSLLNCNTNLSIFPFMIFGFLYRKDLDLVSSTLLVWLCVSLSFCLWCEAGNQFYFLCTWHIIITPPVLLTSSVGIH